MVLVTGMQRSRGYCYSSLIKHAMFKPEKPG
jgi:hypothetical protein